MHATKSVERVILLTVMLLGSVCSGVLAKPPEATQESLKASETAFAKTMADRDFKAFASFVDENAVFINGGNPLRGKPAVLAHWEKFFKEPQAPFAWKPVIGEVSVANGLGYTEGPVTDANGKVVTTFFTTWKVQPDGSWRVVFDNGHDVCNCPKQP